MDENIIVTVSGDAERIAEQLRAAGMSVRQVLVEIGIITGSVDAGHRATLDAIPGVLAVEIEQKVQIAPPDAASGSADLGSGRSVQLPPADSEIQ